MNAACSCRLGIALLLSCGFLFSQTENWVYTYTGPGYVGDCCQCIAYGDDGNLYTAGFFGDSTYYPNQFCNLGVISLTDSGTQRWMYEYAGPGIYQDEAYDIEYGPDGNVYVVGYSDGGGASAFDITVISLKENGVENWVYIYDGCGHDDHAYEIDFDASGNLYIVGWSTGSGTSYDIVVISLTPAGVERWVYRYNGAGDYYDMARAIVCGTDGNIYVAGNSSPSTVLSEREFVIISLTDSGTANWIYTHEDSLWYYDWAADIIYGADGNLYVAGYTCPTQSTYAGDFTVFSLSTAGGLNWMYKHNGVSDSDDGAVSLVYGPDDNIYAGGFVTDFDFPNYDLAVVSLTNTGDENWVYTYNGSANHNDNMSYNSLAWGNGAIYAGSYQSDSATGADFLVVSLSPAGDENWRYAYDGPWTYADDAGEALICGDNNRVYTVGYSLDGNTGDAYYTVISLNDDTGINEQRERYASRNRLRVAPSVFTKYTYISIDAGYDVIVTIYDVTGQVMQQWNDPTIQPSNHVVWDGTNKEGQKVPAGVYFVHLDTDNHYASKKVVHLK